MSLYGRNLLIATNAKGGERMCEVYEWIRGVRVEEECEWKRGVRVRVGESSKYVCVCLSYFTSASL